VISAIATRPPATVGDLMTADPIVVGIDTTLADAAELMDFYHVTGLPVCDWSGFLVGVVSQTDVVHALASDQLREAWPRLIVRHVMSHPAVTVHVDASLVEAARLMRRRGIHRLVVVAPEGENAIGILSATDLVRWVTDEDARQGATP
jgi:CBS domain-containing protein